ncbi:MAG: carboxypeptidase-like regulatory domain-containing protein [Planctomycetaceae bacterium]|nr:carboxypeptidase-like regulatory domain-containing protein [Planctomycetaceae bacterium]
MILKTSFIKKNLLILSVAMATIFWQHSLAVTFAFAHQIQIFATVDATGLVRGEVIAENVPVPNAGIDVIKTDGDRLTPVTCDSQGKFQFQLPEPGRYRFLATFADGHEAETTVAFARPLSSLTRDSSVGDASANKSSLPAAEWRETIDALNNRMYDMEMELHRMKTRRHWIDVLAAVGCIFGLAGVYLILKKR